MKKYILIILTLQAFCLNVGAQEKLKGRVIDAQTQQPLAGAVIKVKTPVKTIISNNEGYFELDLPWGTYQLQVQYLAYGAKDFWVRLPQEEALVVRLIATESSLDEIVVIAYGTTTRRLNTGAVGKVTAKEIGQQPVGNPLLALGGRVPGLLVNQVSGVPGAGVSVQIRGQNSLLQGSQPLFIIDGVPFDAANEALNQQSSAAGNSMSALNLINPEDIESIEVLKDADATAIYGSRGANGVILISTKKGQAGSLVTTVNWNAGMGRIANRVSFLDIDQYLAMRREAFANDNLNPENATAPDLLLWEKSYIDFPKLLLGGTSHSNRLQATLRGGTAMSNYIFSASHNKETTVYPTDLGDRKVSFRFNYSTATANNLLRFELTSSYLNDLNKLPTIDLASYINANPMLKLYHSNGGLNWSEAGIQYANSGMADANPLAYTKKAYRGEFNNFNNNLSLNIQPTAQLAFKLAVGYGLVSGSETTLNPYAAIDPGTSIKASSSFGKRNQHSLLIEPQLTYNVAQPWGNLGLLLGGTWQNRKVDGQQLNALEYTNDLLLENPQAAGRLEATLSDYVYRYEGVYARVNYRYNALVLNLSGRRDGSSRFSPENRYENFGAVGAALLLSDMRFWKKIEHQLSFAKLRGSFGVIGNDQIGDYKYLDTWRTTSTTYLGVAVLNPSSLYNPNLKWERTLKKEIALELGFFNNRLFLNTAYYNNLSSNQLVNYTLPSQTGFSSVLANLNAQIRNTGWEFELKAALPKGKLGWSSSITITLPKNTLVSFPNLALSSYANTYHVGKSVNTRSVYHYIGVDPQTGFYTVEDANNDGRLTIADRTKFINTNPDFFGGLANNFSFRGLTLDVFFEFRKQLGKNYLENLNGFTPGVTLYNIPSYALERWQTPGQSATVQKFTTRGSTLYTQQGFASSDGVYSDASFIRLKNISLSYLLPTKITGKLKLQQARFTLGAQNLLTFTKYVGADPETQHMLVMPPLKVWVAGVNISF